MGCGWLARGTGRAAKAKRRKGNSSRFEVFIVILHDASVRQLNVIFFRVFYFFIHFVVLIARVFIDTQLVFDYIGSDLHLKIVYSFLVRRKFFVLKNSETNLLTKLNRDMSFYFYMCFG